MQHFDGWNTLEGRHLVLIYAFVMLAQGGYFIYVLVNWFRMHQAQSAGMQRGEEKATRSF